MEKREAFKLARQYCTDNPTMAGRRVRVTDTAEGDVTTVWRTRIGKRGGMAGRAHVGSMTHETLIHTELVGAVLTYEVRTNGWPHYFSTVVLPHWESDEYADANWRPEFTLDEKEASARWAYQHGLIDAEAWTDIINWIDELRRN